MSKLFTSVLVAAALVTGAIQPVSARPHDRTISDNNISKKSAPAKQFFEQLQRDSD